MERCLVLLSGGLDSAVATAMIRQQMTVSLAVTFDYGQRAAAREIDCAQSLAKTWDIPHQVITLPWLAECSNSALTQRQQSLPQFGSTRLLDDAPSTRASAIKVWVPNRNGVFLNIAASIAEAQAIPWIVTGFNREEAVTFPDNSSDYIAASNAAFHFSTLGKVNLISPTQPLVKSEIVAWAKKNDVPLDRIWPCYEGGATWCGRCESCMRFQRAMGA